MKLNNKTLLVTGASSGIGKAVALRAAQDGGHIFISARDKEKLELLKKEIEELGATAQVIVADVTNDEQIKEMFLEIAESGKDLDAVFNNAGLGFIGNIWELKSEDIHKIVNVNVTGMIMVTKYATEVMTRQKSGHIIMTSSMAGLVTLPEWSVYCASKWAIRAFADSIRFELKEHNVKVSTLHPGAVKTEFFDKDKANIGIDNLGDAIEPSEVANAVYDALFTNKKKIFAPSSVKAYGFLQRIAPGLTEKLIERMTKNVEYHENMAEDEPEFDKI